MKVLWAVFITFPELAEATGRKAEYAGTWIRALADKLRNLNNIELTIVSVGDGSYVEKFRVNGTNYYMLPGGRHTRVKGSGKHLKNAWKQIVEEVEPDVIHVHGSEYALSLELFNLNINIPIIVSLQGILSEYYRYHYGGLEFKDIFCSFTIRDAIRFSGMVIDRVKMKKQIKVEQEILTKTKHVIGRTAWDKAAALNINPNLYYHYCSEVMRSEFYNSDKWDITNINRYTIFIHQGTKPIKGLHFLLEAVYRLKSKFPKIKIVMSGTNYLGCSSVKDKLKISGYPKYLRKLIKRWNLENNIEFLGVLSSQQIVNQLLKAHVMVLPSSIENSPNSLVEAMLIGIPCIASFVGGIPDMLINSYDSLLYPYDEPGLLATNISKVFESDELAQELSKNVILSNNIERNPNKIVKDLLDIYSDIIQ